MIRFALLFAFLASLASTAAHSEKVVVIDSQSLMDIKTGIPVFAEIIKTADREFEPAKIELGALLQKQRNVLKALDDAKARNEGAQIAKLNDDMKRLEADFAYKSKETQARYDKRLEALLKQANDKVAAAFKIYAVEKNIDGILTSTLDIAYASDRWVGTANATADFISWYKLRYP